MHVCVCVWTSICRQCNLVSPTNRLSTLSLLFFRFIYHMAPLTYTTSVAKNNEKFVLSVHMCMYVCMYKSKCMYIHTSFLTKCELSATNELRARGWLAVNWSAGISTADAMVNEFNEVTSSVRQMLPALSLSLTLSQSQNELFNCHAHI